jgi:hypothetical protein
MLPDALARSVTSISGVNNMLSTLRKALGVLVMLCATTSQAYYVEESDLAHLDEARLDGLSSVFLAQMYAGDLFSHNSVINPYQRNFFAQVSFGGTSVTTERFVNTYDFAYHFPYHVPVWDTVSLSVDPHSGEAYFGSDVTTTIPWSGLELTVRDLYVVLSAGGGATRATVYLNDDQLMRMEGNGYQPFHVMHVGDLSIDELSVISVRATSFDWCCRADWYPGSVAIYLIGNKSNATPEPATLFLLTLGLAGLGISRLRRPLCHP